MIFFTNCSIVDQIRTHVKHAIYVQNASVTDITAVITSIWLEHIKFLTVYSIYKKTKKI